MKNTNIILTEQNILNYISDNKIIHVSFDYWNTIAFSNPKFKYGRSNLLMNFNNKITNIEVIDTIFKSIGSNYNHEIENGYEVKQPTELFTDVCNEIGINNNREIIILFEKTIELFYEYPPSLSLSFIETIIRPLTNNGITCSITSNTAFIPGKAIKKAMSISDSDKLFKYFIFSDEVNCAKPHNKIFNLIIEQKQNLNKNQIVTKNRIVHIGDSLKADYYGAISFGFKAILI